MVFSRKRKSPAEMNPAGLLFWRRPTLAQPIVALPSGLQRFTSVFGMGTGGSTALGSPDREAGLAGRCFASRGRSASISGDVVAAGLWPAQARRTATRLQQSLQK